MKLLYYGAYDAQRASHYSFLTPRGRHHIGDGNMSWRGNVWGWEGGERSGENYPGEIRSWGGGNVLAPTCQRLFIQRGLLEQRGLYGKVICETNQRIAERKIYKLWRKRVIYSAHLSRQRVQIERSAVVYRHNDLGFLMPSFALLW